MLGRAPPRRQLLGRCRLRSPRASLAAPRGIQSAGGCPGNGRARVASATAPVYYCDSIYFLFGGLGERKKKNPRWGQGGVGRRRARERSRGGDGGGQWLSPASSRAPRVPGERAQGKETQLITTLRRQERPGQGSPHTRHPAVGQRLRPLGPQPARPMPCFLPSLQSRVEFFAPTASGMRCASFFICDQVGFLILSWGMRKEVGNSATLRNTTGGMVLAHCVFGGVVVFVLLGAGWEAG